MTLWHFDNFDNQLGTIHGLKSCVYEFKLSESHELNFTCDNPVEKEDRILWQDRTGKWHEFIVEDAVDAGPKYEVACVDSIDELSGDYHVEREPQGDATTLLTALLENSRWEVGMVDVPGTGRCSWYHISALEALGELCETMSCEWSTTIEVSGDHVVARKVNLTTRLGKDTGNRFTYGHNLKEVTRSRGQNKIYTRVYGYGKGEAVSKREDGTTNYGRKITFGSVNGDKDYVESEEARDRWGRPDGKGSKAHVIGKVEFPDCEDPSELLRLTTEWAEGQYNPQISYTASVIDLSRGGLDPSAVDEGDGVAIIDTTFDPPLRIVGRVLGGKIDLLNNEADYTIGNLMDTLARTIVKDQRRTQRLSDRSGEWDAAVSQPNQWLNDLISHLNEQFNAGGSYKYESFDAGTIYSSVPLDKNGKPTRTPATAIQLCGEGFRIADSVNIAGEFNWRTFGTGAGFTADLITGGTISGDHIEGGTINGAVYRYGNDTAYTLIDGRSLHTTDGTSHVEIDGRYGITAHDDTGEVEIDSYGIKVRHRGDNSLSGYTRVGYDGIHAACRKSDLIPEITHNGYVDIGISDINGLDCFSPISYHNDDDGSYGWVVVSKDANSFHFVWNTNSPYLEFKTLFGAYGITAWSSDARKKEHIEATTINATDVLREIKHKRFRWKDIVDGLGDVHQGSNVDCGYVAQEMQDLNPAFVITVAEGTPNEQLQINETILIPYITKSLQEIDARVTVIESQLQGKEA